MAYSPYSVGSNSTSPSQTSPLPYVKTEQHVRHGMPMRPRLVILEQPQERFRFRYESELGGTHGQLAGRSGAERRSFPTVKLEGFQGKANIKCELFTVSDTGKPPVPHVHTLQGRYCANGAADFSIDHTNDYTASFQGLGIIHTARKAMLEKIKRRKLMEKTTGPHWKPTEADERQATQEANSESLEINMNRVCLRFRALVQDPENFRFRDICDPVFSDPIYNGKSAQTGELKIVQLSEAYSPCTGNKEIWLLVERVRKNDIKVRFYEEDDNKHEIWHAYGKVSKCHHQYAIIFQTPAYHNKDLRGSVRVWVQLERPSDGCVSEPKNFQYTERDQRATKRLGIQQETAEHKRSRTVDEGTGESCRRSQDGGRHPSPAPRWPTPAEVAPLSADYYAREQRQYHSPQARAEWERAHARRVNHEPRADDRGQEGWVPARGHAADVSAGGFTPPAGENSPASVTTRGGRDDPIEARYIDPGCGGSSDSIPYVEIDGDRREWERGKARDEPKTRGLCVGGDMRSPMIMSPGALFGQRSVHVPSNPGHSPVPSSRHQLPKQSGHDTAIDLSMSGTSIPISSQPSSSSSSLPWRRPFESFRGSHSYSTSSGVPSGSPLSVAYSHANIPTVVNNTSPDRLAAESRWQRDDPTTELSHSRDRAHLLGVPTAADHRESMRSDQNANLDAHPRYHNVRRPLDVCRTVVSDGVPSSTQKVDYHQVNRSTPRGNPQLERAVERSADRPPDYNTEPKDRGKISVRRELGVINAGQKTRSAPPDLIRIAPDPGRISTDPGRVSTDSARARVEMPMILPSSVASATQSPLVVRPRSLPVQHGLPPVYSAITRPRSTVDSADLSVERERILASEALLKLRNDASVRRVIDANQAMPSHMVANPSLEMSPRGDAAWSRCAPDSFSVSRNVDNLSAKAEVHGRVRVFSRSQSVTEMVARSQGGSNPDDNGGEQPLRLSQTSKRSLEAPAAVPVEGRVGTADTLVSESSSGSFATSQLVSGSQNAVYHSSKEVQLRDLEAVSDPLESSLAPRDRNVTQSSEGAVLTAEANSPSREDSTVTTSCSETRREFATSRRTISERSSVEDDRLVIDDPESLEDSVGDSSRTEQEPMGDFSLSKSSVMSSNGPLSGECTRLTLPETLSMPSLVNRSQGELAQKSVPEATPSVVMATSAVAPVAQVVDYVNTSAGQVKISIDMSQLTGGSSGNSLAPLKTSSPPQPGAV